MSWDRKWGNGEGGLGVGDRADFLCTLPQLPRQNGLTGSMIQTDNAPLNGVTMPGGLLSIFSGLA